MPADPALRVSRRTLLLGTAGALALVACSTEEDPGATMPTAGVDAEGRSLVALFKAAGPFLVSGQQQRAPLTIGDRDGLPFPDAVPDLVSMRVLAEDGTTEVVAAIEVSVHRAGVPVPYFPHRFTVETPGTYFLEAQFEDTAVRAAVSIVEPAAVTFPLPGSSMQALQTPTTDETRGVDPICTLVPPCRLHERSLDTLVGRGRPVLVLVATPQFCHTSFCGPVLELLLEELEQHPGLDAVHLEVYESGEAARSGTSNPAPAVRDLGLDFEPALLVVDGDGKVVDVVASIMDRVELADAIAQIS